jgi:sugar phosphate isomerase/epimerase
VQLWSVRDRLAIDVDGALTALSTIGFEAVETAFYDPATDLTAMGARFRSHGLAVAAAHVELPLSQPIRDHVSRQVDALGVDTILAGSRTENRFRDAAGRDAIVEELTAASEWATSQGLTFGIHNHWWELNRAESGRLVWAEIFERLPAQFVVEPDCYWSTMAGVTVAEFVEASRGRAPLFHLKDGPAENPVDPMTALGEGRVDLAEALTSARNARWWVAELSHCAGDMFDALRTSYQYLDHARALAA